MVITAGIAGVLAGNSLYPVLGFHGQVQMLQHAHSMSTEREVENLSLQHAWAVGNVAAAAVLVCMSDHPKWVCNIVACAK